MKSINSFLCYLRTGHVWALKDNMYSKQCILCGKLSDSYGPPDFVL